MADIKVTGKGDEYIAVVSIHVELMSKHLNNTKSDVKVYSDTPHISGYYVATDSDGQPSLTDRKRKSKIYKTESGAVRALTSAMEVWPKRMNTVTRSGTKTVGICYRIEIQPNCED